MERTRHQRIRIPFPDLDGNGCMFLLVFVLFHGLFVHLSS